MMEPTNAQWTEWENRLQKWFVPLFVAAVVVNAGGLFIPILEPDGSLYATIAKTIAHTGDFINLRVDGRDWLDKPHFPFWMAALSYRLMGVNSFAYKFPALLFWAAGAWYTWRLAFNLYGKTVSQLAVLFYMTAAHLVISNNDVRAEPYLTGLIIGSVYHFYRASRSGPRLHLLAGSLLAGCACMTKGPFVLITIGGGFIIDWVWTKDWEQFRNPRWWLAIALTALFTLPELICLYLQFDRHPEKVVFGRNHVSGVRFFFWDSQFGRFFNTGPIKGSGDPFFYFHTVLWAFLPWSLLLYAAIYRQFRKSPETSDGQRIRRPAPGHKLCLGATLLTFLVFSLSRFQLPHYLNILFPFFSILTAYYLYNIQRRGIRKTIRIVQDSINVLLPVLLLFLTWFIHFQLWPLIMTTIALLAVLTFRVLRGRTMPSAVFRSAAMSLLVFAFINFILYPAILKYQAGTQAARYLRGYPYDHEGDDVTYTAYLLQEAPVSYSFEFDSPFPVERVPIDSLEQATSNGRLALVFAPSSFADSLAAKGYLPKPIRTFPYFHISQLTGEFLGYGTRNSVLTPWSLFEVKR
jgi:4-amino-4-deoxy-L-arabinose transferase-like glycosyltransferase